MSEPLPSRRPEPGEIPPDQFLTGVPPSEVTGHGRGSGQYVTCWNCGTTTWVALPLDYARPLNEWFKCGSCGAHGLVPK